MGNLPDWLYKCMKCKYSYENPKEAGEYLCRKTKCQFKRYDSTYKKYIKDSTELSGGTLW